MEELFKMAMGQIEPQERRWPEGPWHEGTSLVWCG